MSKQNGSEAPALAMAKMQQPPAKAIVMKKPSTTRATMKKPAAKSASTAAQKAPLQQQPNAPAEQKPVQLELPETMYKTWHLDGRPGYKLTSLQIDLAARFVHETWQRSV